MRPRREPRTGTDGLTGAGRTTPEEARGARRHLGRGVSGTRPPLTADEILAGVDLRGRVAVVTGASGGLGLQTASSLAAAGADVVMGMRDSEHGRAAAERVAAAAAPGARVSSEALDLASLEAVRGFAAAVLARHDRIDLLVNNAGVMAGSLVRTAEGFEYDIGINHLGHFLLTTLLAPALIAAAPARVVNISSRAHRSSDIIWDDPHFRSAPFDKFAAYGQSKTANSLFSVELDRRLGPRGVRAYAVFPGHVETGLFRDLNTADWDQLSARLPAGHAAPLSVEAGAATIVWAATSPGLDAVGGVYLENCHVGEELAEPGAPEGYMPHAVDPVSAARLWEWSEREVGQAAIGG